MLKETWKYLNSLELGKPDPYTSSNPICWSPFQMMLFNLVYLLFIFYVGPKFMENRRPFKLKKILLAYNLAQVLLNCIGPIIAFLMMFVYRVIEPGCMLTLPIDHPQKHFEVISYSIYLFLKMVDYMDTVFFVLRKSTRQITFLHVYHHLLMANACNLYVRYYGYGGHVGVFGTLNSLVHVVMYFYYFTTALNPSMKALWWKKYITILQLVQFIIIFLHNLYPLIYRQDCQYPHALHYLALTQSVTMLYLFGKFYINTYVDQKKSKAKEK